MEHFLPIDQPRLLVQDNQRARRDGIPSRAGLHQADEQLFAVFVLIVGNDGNDVFG